MGVLGIILAIVAIIILVMKKCNVVITTLIASIIAMVFNGMPIVDTLTNVYQTSFGTFIANYVLLLFLGAIYGYFMEKSGCATSFANWLIKIAGPNYAVLALPIVSGLMIYGGVIALVSVFTMMPIIIRVLQEANIPRRFFPAIATISGNTWGNCGPGTPAVMNLIVAGTFGLAPTYGGIPGWIGLVLLIVLTEIALAFNLRLARKHGEVYVPHEMDSIVNSINEEDLPSPIIAIIILVSVPLLLNIPNGEGGTLLTPTTTMFLACVLAYALNFKRLDYKEFFTKDATARLTSTMWMIACTGAMSGFGAVIAASNGFQDLINFALGLPGAPYFKLIVMTNILSAATGSATASCNIVAPAIGPYFVELGLPAGYVGRVMAISATAFDSLPNNAGVFAYSELAKVDVKDSYPPFFLPTVIVPLVTSIIVAILCMLIPA